MKITVFTCFHCRPEISRKFVEAVRKLSVPMKIFVVVSEEDPESAELCKELGIEFIRHKNSPLGAKWNAGIQHVLFDNPDYVVISGDDDILTESWLQTVLPHMKAGVPFGGVDSAYMVLEGTQRAGKIKYIEHKMLGCGAFISGHALRLASEYVHVSWVRSVDEAYVKKRGEPIRYTLARHLQDTGRLKIMGQPFFQMWTPTQPNGLDRTRDLKLAEMGFYPEVIRTEKPTILCLKSGRNIWRFEKVISARWATECDYNEAVSIL